MVAYGIHNALFEWEAGERRLREAPQLEPAVAAVRDELRRRLGSSFTVEELAAFYASGVDWAWELAWGSAREETASAVDAAFGRYVREATDYAGGRPRRSALPRG